MAVKLPPKGRDLRLDLICGVANWQIFINHIPNNKFNWITTEYYGFSDAADLFIFISGYTASFVYARIMLERGTWQQAPESSGGRGRFGLLKWFYFVFTRQE